MIDGEKEDPVRLRDRLRPLVTGPGDGCDDDMATRKFPLHPLQEGNGAEDLAHRCRMNPDRPPEGKAGKESQPLDELFSKSFVEEAPEKEIRRDYDEQKSKENIIKMEDHCNLKHYERWTMNPAKHGKLFIVYRLSFIVRTIRRSLPLPMDRLKRAS